VGKKEREEAMPDERDVPESQSPPPPSYRRMRSIFLRSLGAVYLAAFVSLTVQLDGLIGSRGILPAAEFLDAVHPILGRSRFAKLPTLLWLDSSDQTLHLLGWGGVVTSALLVVGVMPLLCLVLLWLGYLSLVVVGQPFLGYQWDALLLESGLLGILFAPWTPWLGWARREPLPEGVWLIRWLVFRLMFESGVVKLTSGDPTWRNWTALTYHYETQPLPVWASWYMHQLPGRLQAVSTGFMYWAELIAPWLIFGPRRVRMLGFGSMVLLQVLIAATGNYGFFNVLSVVLCLSLVEDRDWSWRRNAPEAATAAAPAEPPPRWLRRIPVDAAGVVIVLVTTMHGLDRLGWAFPFPEPFEVVQQWVDPFQSMNAYGLFAVMTTERPEIIVEGSDDGESWVPYAFRWKPGDVDRRPRFTTPHMPRLDWQMWFAALAGDCRSQRWFLAFEQRLLEGSPTVLGLLKGNPFPARPPRLLRARLYQYHFTGRGASAWWWREELGRYCPPLGL
jgi:hypothetical protein